MPWYYFRGCYNKYMLSRTIVTAGRAYLDIDAYASMISYRELLRSTTSDEVLAFSTAKPNQTVPPMLQNLGYKLDKRTSTDEARFVLVDVSNPDFFDTFVKQERVSEIIDHHHGYEEYWRNNRVVKSQIEAVGAACTQIYEHFIEADRADLLGGDLAKLLIAGILDNTINLKSKLTTKRDLEAYSELKRISGLDDDFGRDYFLACEKEKIKNLKRAILADMKVEWACPLLPEAIGQIILFNHSKLTREMLDTVFTDYNKWIINVISLEDGRSYLYCSDAETKVGLSELFGDDADYSQENLIILNDFILRKEILKRARLTHCNRLS